MKSARFSLPLWRRSTPICPDAAAQNLLSGGDFELVGSDIAGWNLEEFATGSGAALDTASVVSFAPDSGIRELWLKGFAGGNSPGPNNLTNAILSQTVVGIAGETYAFSGSSRGRPNLFGRRCKLERS